MFYRQFKFLFFIFCLLSFSQSFAATQITAVTVSKTQLILTLSQSPQYQVFTLDNPNRLVIDLQNTQLRGHLPRSLAPAIIRLRTGKRPNNGLRIVADLKHPIRYQHTTGHTGQVWKLVIDIASSFSPPPKRPEPAEELDRVETETAFLKAAKVLPNEETKTPILKKTEKIQEKIKEKPKITRPIVVIIDAGHGGKDPGAISASGTREKHVSLAIATRLQRLLNKETGIRAILTRNGDYYMGLRDRLRIARKYKADVFVSIHADAFKTPQAYGASVFALSPSGASSEAARWLAEKENFSELGSVNMDDKGAALRSVLLDLSQTATISLSVQMGSHVLAELNQIARLHNSTVEQARFVVLKSPDIPSILVETGFISNTQEAEKLSHPKYQQRLAHAIYTGIRRYFMQYPPAGTVLAAKRSEINRQLD